MSVNETAARHPNRFLADLTQAMRSTAETARQATIEQCQAVAKGYTEKLQARTDDESASLRKAAEADVSAIRDWSKAEMERIRVETEQRISRRRELLEQELQEYNSAIELEIERVQKRVTNFEEEVANFFEQLLQEADPTVFASMAAQMPDPPSFEDGGDRGNISSDMRARREQIMRAPEPLPIINAAQAEAEAAAAAEAEEAEARAAAERTAAARPATVESTQVVVVGLVSVASIATFKRQLGRLPGVKNVGVSSGPDGEFIFTVGHGSDISLGDLIPTLPAFQARVVSEREGVLNVSAHDPEAEG
jgi:DNA repair exonuclease SbcCD ATPase subunit